MENNQNNSPNKVFLSEGQGKDNNNVCQEKTIFTFLQTNVATASMISESTNIPQKNICRYKRDLEKAGLLWEVEKSKCKHTGFKAWYLTTNPELAPTNNVKQLTLF